MIAVSIPWTVLIPAVVEGPDPADVKPGWIAFVIFLALAAAVVFLSFSLRKHLKRVNFEEKSTDAPKDGDRSDS